MLTVSSPSHSGIKKELNRMKRVFFVLSLSLLTAAAAFAQTDRPQLLQKPTVSRTHIVFSYAGDLWTVSREGGDATRLTTGVGIETDPLFSPDGKSIAFTGEYDGNTDIYVVGGDGRGAAKAYLPSGRRRSGRLDARQQARYSFAPRAPRRRAISASTRSRRRAASPKKCRSRWQSKARIRPTARA